MCSPQRPTRCKKLPMADPPGAARPRRGGSARSKPALAGSVPDPPPQLHVTLFVWRAGRALHRVHLDAQAGNAFNPGLKGNARFSPILDAAGRPIPTLYGGTSFACAAMETVFHDVPFAPGLKTFPKRKLQGQMHCALAATKALALADLRNVPLRKLGVERNRLIDTEKDTYPQTRKWAAAIHAQHARIQGLCWISGQDDSTLAVMLFGDRIEARLLTLQTPSRRLLDDAGAYMALLALADMISVRIVADKA
jgi:RES domain